MATIANSEDFIPLTFEQMPQTQMLSVSSEFYHSLKTRRSLRDFSSKTFPVDIINNAIKAAGTAPSGANRQPWHFVVVSNPEIKKKIRLAAEEEERKFYQQRATQEWLKDLEPLGTDEHKPFLETAPYLIVIFLKKFTVDEDGSKHKNYYTSESVGIATGMLISALHMSGVATLTHTPSPMKFLNEILGRPSYEKPFLILVAGYPADNTKVPNIKKYSLENICDHLD